MPSPSGSSKRRLARALSLPTVSGKASALWLFFCFVLSAVLIPLTLKLPTWIEFEIVVVLWWLIWIVALAYLLYSGWHITDDHAWTGPRNWLAALGGSADSKRAIQARASTATSTSNSSGVDLSALVDVADLGGEGCAWVGAILLAIAAFFFAAWFVLEIALPGVAFVLYFAIRGMLARVVHAGGFCRGDWKCALGFAAVWATVYTAPVAVAVWLVHFLHRLAQVRG